MIAHKLHILSRIEDRAFEQWNVPYIEIHIDEAIDLVSHMFDGDFWDG